jgi:carboxyl-terminal processing protease
MKWKRFLVLSVAGIMLLTGMRYQSDFFQIAKQIEIFTEAFKTINQHYVDETNPGKLMDVALKNMMKDLDPYTTFFDEADVLKFKINNTGEYTGIGALVSRKEGEMTLKEIYEGLPADKAGMKAGDVIIKIGDIDLKDFKEDASQLLKGAKNTKIEVIYKRQGSQKTAQLVLDEVEVKAVPYYKLLEGNIGYIVLQKFNEKTTSETKEALVTLKEQGAKKIILDLRDNPGGLLNEAISICNLFVPKGETIVTTKSQSKAHNNVYKTKFEPVDTEIPLAVIINDRSASASEIVSGGLQDLDRAVVIGNRSFGKGLVQRPFNLSYGTQVKVTISKYYTPSGRCIQAVDYGKKDENGVAIKTDEKNFNQFKTKAGRTVYDGGGVLPDVEVPALKSSSFIQTLSNSDAIFNFATQLYYKNPTAKSASSISDADFTAFKEFVKREKIEVSNASTRALKSLIEATKKDKIDAEVLAEIKNMEAALERVRDKELDKNKDDVKRLLYQELLLRYGYKKALFEHVATQYADVQKAISVLNSGEYNKILKK